MQNIYETFEFYKIQEFLLEHAKTEVGRESIRDLVMLPNIDSVKEELEDLKEVLSIIQRFGPLPISPSLNAIRMLQEAKRAGILTARDLDMIAEDVLTSLALIKFMKKIEVGYPRISNKVLTFADLTNLEKEIHRVINSAQGIKDKASDKLFQIRTKLKKVEASLQDRVASLAASYSTYLNDTSVTLRDGHFVLPVKTAYKNKIPGVVYDVSDSGNTTFIEPIEIVQINVEITSLRCEENEEIRRILKELTNLVLLNEYEILNNNQIIGVLDFLSCKANYALANDHEIATINNKQYLSLIEARHPLIDRNKVVSNNFYLDDVKRIIIISGPNAGGKTVSLKTVGLIVLMNQCGLAVPVKKAELGYFKNIFIDIGDNQSLSDNLSTFSAHMSQISEIIRFCGGKDLILVDELGTGTDPKEGEALALGIVKFLEKKHVLAMISSHFGALKEYAFLSETLDNSSMIFDETNLVPTYIFRQGAPGKSYALDVATRYGIPEEVVKDAKDYAKKHENSQVDDLMRELQLKVNEVAKLEKELLNKQREIERKEKRLAVDEENLKNRRDHLLEEVKNTKKDMIDKAKEEIDYIISQLSNGDLKLHEVIELKNKLEELEENEETEEFNEVIELNDYISVPSLGIYGRVVRLKGTKAKIQSDSGMSFDIDVNKLHKEEKPKVGHAKPSKNREYEDIINTSVSLELNIIGLRVEEAMSKVTKYIDNCRLKRLKQVRIIHGFGSGALRNATRKYLDTQKDLTYRPGGEYEGGGGATVVIFND